MNINKGNTRERVVLGDITGMIDVVFLLIIFFLTTSTLVRLNAAPVDLPSFAGDAEPDTQERPIVVNLTDQGHIVVDRVPLSWDDLSVRLAAEVAARDGQAAGITVLLRADRSAPVGDVDRVARILIETGIASWSIGTAVPPSQNGGPE